MKMEHTESDRKVIIVGITKKNEPEMSSFQFVLMTFIEVRSD
jgi:hypothetical protein